MFEPAPPGCSFVIACGCCVSEAHLEPETIDFPVTSERESWQRARELASAKNIADYRIHCIFTVKGLLKNFEKGS